MIPQAGDPVRTRTVTANLKPGYVLICHVKEGGVGDSPVVSHYQNGMRTGFTVTQ